MRTRSGSFAFVAAAVAIADGGARAQIELRDYTGGKLPWDFGQSVANAGDLNGDGADDLLVGEPGFQDSNRHGRVYVYSGKFGGKIRIHDPLTTNGDSFGTAVASVGDLDGDSVPDYAIGAQYWDRAKGYVAAFSGATGAQLWVVQGTKDQERLGIVLAAAGDLDGDGLSELLATRGFTDSVDVITGTGALLYTVTGQKYGLFGWSLAGLADLDGDGVPEFAVGEPGYSDVNASPPLFELGRVRIYSGATGTVLKSSVGAASFDSYGGSLRRGADYDGDGFDDLLIGATGVDAPSGVPDAGMVLALSSKANVAIWTSYGEHADDGLGAAVAATGDVDLDGIPEVLGGAPSANGDFGAVDLFSGSDGRLLAQVQGEIKTSWYGFGSGLAGGDWNGDGIGDWVVGDRGYFDDVKNDHGAVHVFVGCPARAASYGAGWPGTNGVPSLDCTIAPGIDSIGEIQVGNSQSGLTLGLLFLGFDDGSFPTGGGTLLVAPAYALPFYVYGPTVKLWGRIPDDESLAFLDLFVQAVESDPGAVNGLSFSPGLKLTIGFDFR